MGSTIIIFHDFLAEKFVIFSAFALRGTALSANPIDITEALAAKMNLSFSRMGDNEISIHLKADRPKYILSVVLKSDYEMIYFSCDMNLRVPKKKRVSIMDAIIRANERIWIGHFDLISVSNCIVYSLAIPFVSSFLADEEIIQSIIQLIRGECNHFYHYFSLIIEDKEVPEISSMFLETIGEA
ncbi:MAG: YbjN domain-containing protein [Holosporaceae bacterium]|jgi:hypothetical protein|nr:YbjN domain-containing protein [Holosporaceae bacterium]